MRRAAKVDMQAIDYSAAFSRTQPQCKLGPGMRVKLNAPAKRLMLARAKRLRANRASFLFWAIATGALRKHEVDEAGL